MLTIECPECGKIHKFSVDGVLEKGTIYCSCGKTIIVDNANQFIEKIDELERPSPQVALSTKEEKMEEKEKVEKPKEEKPKVEKPQTEKPKTEKLKEAKTKEEKPKNEKPTEKKTINKKSKKEEANK
jgi:outer membrane biosynthesis protein TonB